MNKPIVLSDLDDTLFQTRRKMVGKLAGECAATAALDREGNPNSFVNVEQKMLIDWFLQTAELIPVTARGTEEISRVKIDFTSWAITTHGAVVLQPNGEPDPVWKSLILASLEPYQQKLLQIQAEFTRLMAERNINAFARINYEYDGIAVYLVIKTRDKDRVGDIYALSDEVRSSFGDEGFYIHSNANNIAWLPTPIEKGLAAKYLLSKLRKERGPLPVLGFGDSLTDYSFMHQCNWFGVPFQSQLAEQIDNRIFSKEA